MANGTAVATIPPQTMTAVQWNHELDGARMLIKSGLLPQSVKSPEAALFIILTGRDLGLSPVQALRSIHVIQGKIEVAADMQLGLFHRSGGRSQWATLTNIQAVLILSAPWLLEPHTESFTMEDATRAGLGGDNWRKYPKAMLRSRAITAGLKSIGFDPTAGIYAEGELGGPEPVPPPAEHGNVVDAEVVSVETAAPAGDSVDDGNAEASVQAHAESFDAAHAELVTLLPTLATNQQRWVREKLADGAEPSVVLAAIKAKLAAAGQS